MLSSKLNLRHTDAWIGIDNVDESDIESIFFKRKSELMLGGTVPEAFGMGLNDMYSWIWLPSADPRQVLEMRNAKHVRSNMRNSAFIAMETHSEFLEEYASLPRIDFVLINKEFGHYIGGMNICLTNNGFEIGKYIGNESYLGKGLSYGMAKSFLEFFKRNFSGIESVYAITKIENFPNINLNFKLGFKIIQRVNIDYWLMVLR